MPNPKTIQHLVEPTRLILAWNEYGGPRYRIGELVKTSEKVLLRYFPKSDDFKKAYAEGFRPFMSFRKPNLEYDTGVMDFFMSRITSRKREDFDTYLQTLAINPEQKNFISDFALLGYGEGRLPSDGFHVINDFSESDLPVEFVTEVAGLKHSDFGNDFSAIQTLNIGDEVILKAEPDNKYDCNAIAMFVGVKKLGYVNRIQAETICRWMNEGHQITGAIHRKNGHPKAPRIFVFIEAV